MDSATDRQIQIGYIPKTGNVTHVCFMPYTVTTSESIDVDIRDVDLTTGTYGSTSYKTGTHAGAFVAGTHYEIPLSTSLAVTAGEFRALILKFTSWSAGNLKIASMTSETRLTPYAIINTTGSDTKSSVTVPMMTLKYDDGSYATMGLIPALASTTVGTAFNSGSTTNRRGNIFQMTRSRRIIGAELMGSMAAGGTADVILYDSGGSALASFSLDGDAVGAASSTNKLEGFFDTPVTVTANTNYRIMLVPTNTTNCGLSEYTFASTAILNAIHEGTKCYKSLYTSAAWDDTATAARCAISLKCDQEDLSTGVAYVLGG